MKAPTVEAVLDINQIAKAARLSPAEARTLMELRQVHPVVVYSGRPLWFADTVHDILEEPACAHG